MLARPVVTLALVSLLPLAACAGAPPHPAVAAAPAPGPVELSAAPVVPPAPPLDDARSQMFREALKVGVRIGFGTDSAVAPHGINAREFSLMTGLGMAPAAALRAAMSVDAELLGVDKQTGTLDPGKLADIVAVPGNPLVDMRQTEHVVFVMRAGRVYKRPAPR